MSKINDFIIENRLMRRALVWVLTYYFLRISVSFFGDLPNITTQGVAAYGLLAGLEREILRFFLQGTEEQALAD